MKNAIKILGIIAIIAVIGFGMASCSSDDDPITEIKNGVGKARYLTADAAGNVYELIVSYTSAGKFAAGIGETGDDYSLGIWKLGQEADKSEGTVSSVEAKTGGAKYGLKNSKGNFKVEVSDAWIVGIEGTIPFAGGTVVDTTSVAAKLTIASSTDVVYDSKWGSDNDDAKAITDFGFIGQGNDHEGFTYVPVNTIVPGTSFTVSGGKATVTLGFVKDSDLEELNTDDMPDGVTVSPSTGVKILRQEEPTQDEDGTYFFVCVKNIDVDEETGVTTLEYASLIYSNTQFTMSGTATHESGEEAWEITENWSGKVNIGWNYYLTKEEIDNTNKTVTVTYSVPANSTTPPADYKWTVLSVDKASSLSPYPKQ